MHVPERLMLQIVQKCISIKNAISAEYHCFGYLSVDRGARVPFSWRDNLGHTQGELLQVRACGGDVYLGDNSSRFHTRGVPLRSPWVDEMAPGICA